MHVFLQLESLQSDIEKLKQENAVLQKFIDKKALELGKEDDEKRKKRNKKATTAMLTAEQKYDISSAIYADTLQEIEQNKKKSEKMIDTLRSGNIITYSPLYLHLH